MNGMLTADGEGHTTPVLLLLPFSRTFLAATFAVIGILPFRCPAQVFLHRFYLPVLLFKLPLHTLAHVWWS